MTASVPQSNYFDKPAIETGDDEVLVFSCLKNEAIRLPYFLDYYRAKGVKSFFIIDNASTDGSGDFLKAQPDVHYFYTEMSYKGSSAGRLWMQELCDHYGMGKWCLTVDVDEMFVWPGVEEMTLTELATYLDVEGAAGLFTVFLDMYSDKPLSETFYEPGEPFLDVCPFYETQTYILDPGSNPPYLSIFGGPRGKKFVEDAEAGNGPMMKKIPLIKWFKGFSYIFSTHSHNFVPLSDVTGALLHFKFFDFFTDLAAYENKRGDRRQTQDYAHYASTMTGGQCFFNKRSLRYDSSADLVRRGVMRANRDFAAFARDTVVKHGPAIEAEMRRLIPRTINAPEQHPSGKFTIAGVNAVWPFVHNPRVVEQFADGETVRRFTNRPRFIEQARKGVTIMDISDEGLLIRIPEGVVYRQVNPRLSLALYSGEDFKGTVPLIPRDGALQIDEGALQPALYRLPLDWAAFAGPDEAVLTDPSLYLLGDEIAADDFLARNKRKNVLRQLGQPLFEGPGILLRPSGDVPADLATVEMDGVIERVDEGHLIGWIKDKRSGDWRSPLAIYINGRFASKLRPGTRRDGLGAVGEEAFIYRFELPLEYFYERGETDLKIDVRVIGRNVSLRRTPLIMAGGGRDFGWDRGAEGWVNTFEGTS
jgi:hypothetical protein